MLKKTAWYSFIHPMRIGALVANGDDGNLKRFDRFGYLLGLAFQISDSHQRAHGGTPHTADLDRFNRFGYLLGLAFQITDDVLNLIGDIGRYGKEIDGDLGKENGPFCSRTRSATPIARTVRGSAASWRGRVTAACRAKCCGSVRFSRAGAASQWAQRSAAALWRRPRRARFHQLGHRRCARKSRPRKWLRSFA